MSFYKCSKCGQDINKIRAFTSLLGETKKCINCSSPVMDIWLKKTTLITLVLLLSVEIYFYQNNDISLLVFIISAITTSSVLLYYLKVRRNPFSTTLSFKKRILLFSLASLLFLILQMNLVYEFYAIAAVSILTIPIYLRLK